MTTNHLSFFSGAIGTRVSVPQKRGASWMQRALAALAAHQKASRDYELLLEMSDHMLEDIGLDRSTIRKEQLRHQRWPWGQYG